MRYLLLLTVFFLFSCSTSKKSLVNEGRQKDAIQSSYGQFAFNNIPFKLKNQPASSFRIVQTRDGETLKIEEFDINGNLIFQYIQGDKPPFFNWTEPHRFIYAFEFDETGKIVKRYAFNSNAGHNVYEYEFENDGIVKTTYARNYPVNGSGNTNPYAGISKIKNFNDLKKSSEVLRMMSSERHFLEVEYLNDKGKPIEINEYSHTYRDSVKTIIEYDDKLNELYRKVLTSKGEVKREINNSYPDKNTHITTIVSYREGKEISSHQFAKVKDEGNESEIEYTVNSGKLNIRFYQYESGYLTKIVVYSTNYKGDLIVPLSKDHKKIAEMVYSYNENGLMDKEEMTNYKTGRTEARTYEYVIEEQ